MPRIGALSVRAASSAPGRQTQRSVPALVGYSNWDVTGQVDPGRRARVAIYRRRGKLFIQAVNETDVMWMASDAVWTLEAHADHRALGAALMRAADASRRVPFAV